MENRIVKAIMEKFINDEAVKKAMSRNNHFTSFYGLEFVTIEMYNTGYYIIGDGTQTKVAKFFNHDFDIIRKPNKSVLLMRYSLKNGTNFDKNNVIVY